ncbi:FAD-dependent oxidoreductase [Agromyces sp. MMS24-JH15]|uniref:FAD-dependent oxidoreductase n=1 Tax=Agromyces sp. MMS24-JH15 TaxID=3243765 RepID=UPI003749FA1C
MATRTQHRTPLRIAIVGGGIAGLALAARLDAARFRVAVFEQYPGIPAVNTSLAVWPLARAALERIGVFGPLAAASPSIDRFPIGTLDGGAVVAPPMPGSILVGRRALLTALHDAVPAETARVDARIDLAAGRAPEVDGAPADLVVGADGVHSAVRRALWGEASAAVATPWLAVRGVLPLRFDEGEYGERWGRGWLFGAGPHADGTNWFSAFRSELGPRDVDVEAALAELRAHAAAAADLPHATTAILEAVDPGTTLAQRIHAAPPLRHVVARRGAGSRRRPSADAIGVPVALVGDAAHAMTPNLGRGAGEALVDAVTLAGLLAERPVDEALRAYDRARAARTRRLARASDLVMRVALAERGQPWRDRVLRVAAAATGGRRTGPAPAPAPATAPAKAATTA